MNTEHDWATVTSQEFLLIPHSCLGFDVQETLHNLLEHVTMAAKTNPFPAKGPPGGQGVKPKRKQVL